MKITPLTIDFDVTNEQEVAFVNDLMNRLFGSAPLKAMAAPTETPYRDWETDRKSTRLNSSHRSLSRMPSSA